MEKETKQPTTDIQKTNPKAKRPSHSNPAQGTEFAGELTKSDIQSAFQNPVTGEERLY